MLQQPPNMKNQISNQQTTPNQLLSLPDSDDAQKDFTSTPWWRRRRGIITICIGLLVLLLGALFIAALNRKPAIAYDYQTVSQGNLSLTVSATGPLQSATYNLVFTGQGGKINEIDVKIGQAVTQGQVLAQLDKTSLQDAVDQQQTAVNNAQANLNGALAAQGTSQGQGGANVSSAQTGVSNAQASQNATQSQSQASVSSAQTALDNAKASLSQVQRTAATQKQLALNQLNQQTAVCDATATAVKEGTPSPTSATCQQVAQSQYNQTVAQADQSVATAQQLVNTDQAALTQAQAAANTSNTTAQGNLNTAQGNLNTAQAGANASNSTTQNSVTTAQGNLNSALALLDQANHNLDNATLKAPHSGIVTLINGTVGGSPGAPSSGSTATTTAGGGTFIQIVDTSALQVQANINESDTANLKIGQPAQFSVNAYGDHQFQGTVSAIPPIGQTVSNVVTYPVSIDVKMSSLKGSTLLPGMTANITVTVVQRQNVLQVPVNAVNFARLASTGNAASGIPQLISKQNATSAVNQARQMLQGLENGGPDVTSENPIPAFVLERLNGQFIPKPVVLGLTDGTMYEVLSGLSLNETFVACASATGKTG